MSDGGKGSKPRPIEVDADTYADNWDRIFGKKKPKEEPLICPVCAEGGIECTGCLG